MSQVGGGMVCVCMHVCCEWCFLILTLLFPLSLRALKVRSWMLMLVSTCYVKLCLCMCVSLCVCMRVRAPIVCAYVTSSKHTLSSKQLHTGSNCSLCLLVTQSLSILCASNFFIPHSWPQVTDRIPNPPIFVPVQSSLAAIQLFQDLTFSTRHLAQI